jgi:uncharacterized membrane protein
MRRASAIFATIPPPRGELGNSEMSMARSTKLPTSRPMSARFDPRPGLGRWTLRLLGVRNPWMHHPSVRSGDDLTLGERSADVLRNSMGSWPFVFGALIFLALWLTINIVIGPKSFDHYPFILLNLLLSCLAALQGAILLIAARRADSISGQLAQSDHQIDSDTLATVTEIRDLTREVHVLTTQLQAVSDMIYQHVKATAENIT